MANKCTIATWKKRTEETYHEHIEQYANLEVDLLLLGDSMFERLKTTGKDFWPETSLICNAGVGGDKIQNVLWRLEQGLLTKIKARKIILMIGTNNVETDSISNICEGIVAILKEISTEVVVLGILPRNPHPSDRKAQRIKDTIKGVNEWLKLNLKIPYLDHSEPFFQRDDLYEDHVHLNEEGYQIWCKLLNKINQE